MAVSVSNIVKRSHYLSRHLQNIELLALRRGRVPRQNLGMVDAAAIHKVYADDVAIAAFDKALEHYASLQDQNSEKIKYSLLHPRALFFLILYFKPRSVLEIGTFNGASTFFLASAMQACGAAENACVTTVDIIDVNAASDAPWKKRGRRFSSQEMIRAAGIDIPVEFASDGSHAYFRTCKQTFDFIFIDGSHRAIDVYDDIVNSLQKTRAGGCIILHDYYEKGRRMKAEAAPIPGVYLAVQRAIRAAGNLSVVQVDPVPWLNEQRRYETSLALLTSI